MTKHGCRTGRWASVDSLPLQNENLTNCFQDPLVDFCLSAVDADHVILQLIDNTYIAILSIYLFIYLEQDTESL